jgi:hypothetical protein
LPARQPRQPAGEEQGGVDRDVDDLFGNLIDD